MPTHQPWESYDWKSWIGMRRGKIFESGQVRLAILSLIGEKPSHGYELMKELEVRSGGMYKVSAGTMYPTLQLLEDEGLILSEANEGRRVYRITDAGRAELERERDTVNDIWSRSKKWEDWASVWNPDTYSEVGGSLGQLTKSVFQTLKSHRGDTAMSERVSRVLDRAANEIRELGAR